MDHRTARDITLELGREEGAAARVWLRFEPADDRAGGGPFSAALAPGGALVLGSGAGVDVAIDDAAVSARHARATHAGSSIEVVDLGSTNGLHVAGARVDGARLPLGGAFEIGRTRVTIDAVEAERPADAAPLAGLVGSSAAMRRLAADVRRVAALRLPALVRGESGTGKDLVARAIHDESARRGKPFVILNAATISRELADSELFGHLRGAFTGAVRDRRGAFREAHGGTLFLDEIAAIPLELQAKLLRAVEEGAVRPLGGEAPARVDVRLVAATCEPLEEMVATRRFRADLFERLAVCVLRAPPLRERSSDIAPLARHLLATSDLGSVEITRGALAALRAHRWPFNVRELRNVLVQAAVRASGAVRAEHVAAVLAERGGVQRRRVAPVEALRIYEEVGGNVSAAARLAAVPRTTMRDLVRTARRP